MSDIASSEVKVWQALESRARDVLSRYDFSEVRTPVVEPVSVFTHSLGETTEVVEKQMYAFETRGGKAVCLRPEGTAGVMRYVAGAGQDAQDARLFYMGPMFRAERPQAGRRRQFHQLGVETIGAPSPMQDAEVIAMQAAIFDAWGIGELTFRVNTRGSFEDAPNVLAGLRDALEPSREALCEDCQRRLDTNVLRALDCKKEACGTIVSALPAVTTWMAEETVAYFEELCRCLDNLGVDYVIDPLLVRGLDYYQHSIWEVTSKSIGAQDALSGGGRYAVRMGKQSIEGVGFGIGMERVIMALPEEQRKAYETEGLPLVVLVSMNEQAREENLKLAGTLRAQGLRVRMDLSGKSMKAQMKAAGRQQAAWVVIRGESELANGTVALKNMDTGEQSEVSLTELASHLGSVLADKF